jgi:Extensin-like protein C-terminus
MRDRIAMGLLAASATTLLAAGTGSQPDHSPRPKVRPIVSQPQGVSGHGRMPPVLGTQLAQNIPPEGTICGNPAILGDNVGAVAGKIEGCGIAAAVRVRAVSGVRLSRPALMNCPTAQALNTWVQKAVIPAFGSRRRVRGLRVAADYACRSRNNQPGAKLSEHGKGRAVDISAFTLQGGDVITVQDGWVQGYAMQPLRRILQAACGPFSTTIGPDSDVFHADNFHFDTKPRSTPYCH